MMSGVCDLWNSWSQAESGESVSGSHGYSKSSRGNGTSMPSNGANNAWRNGLAWPPARERNSRLGLWCQARSWMAAKAVCLAIAESKMVRYHTVLFSHIFCCHTVIGNANDISSCLTNSTPPDTWLMVGCRRSVQLRRRERSVTT